MKLLALDTATEACSAALWIEGAVLEHYQLAPRRHAALILPMLDAVLAEAGLAVAQLDAIAVGCGPGAFTGVRIAISIAQGIAFALPWPRWHWAQRGNSGMAIWRPRWMPGWARSTGEPIGRWPVRWNCWVRSGVAHPQRSLRRRATGLGSGAAGRFTLRRYRNPARSAVGRATVIPAPAMSPDWRRLRNGATPGSRRNTHCRCTFAMRWRSDPRHLRAKTGAWQGCRWRLASWVGGL